MSAGLFGFIYDTLLARVNDPNNQLYWLPRRLDELDKPNGAGKLLPLQETNWDLGNITGNAGTTFQDAIKGQWWLAKFSRNPDARGHQPLPCPEQPWPHLQMPQVTINGLDNVLACPNPIVSQPSTGYQAVITLQFGYYAGQNNLPTLSPVQVQGQYAIEQCVCSAAASAGGASAPTACDGWASETIHGTGTFAVSLSDVFVDATVDIQVAGAGPDRTLQVVVDTLAVRGAQAGSLPVLTVDQLTLDTSLTWMSDNVWLPAATKALQSADGVQGIITNLNAALNEPNNAAQLAQMLTQQLNKAFDDAFGAVPAGQLPSGLGQQNANPVNQYLYDRTRFTLNNAASGYYLPAVVYSSVNPTLEPFQIAQLALGDQSFSGITFQNMLLTGVTITGLSNITAPPEQLIFGDDAINATLVFSTLNPPPQVTFTRNGATVTAPIPAPPLQLTGDFSITVPDGGGTLGGGFTVTVSESSVAAALAVAGDELDQLQLNFTQLLLQTVALSNINITVSIDSAFAQIINQLLNEDSVKQSLLQGINTQAQSELGALSKTATANIKQLIAAKLGG